MKKSASEEMMYKSSKDNRHKKELVEKMKVIVTEDEISGLLS